MFPVETADAERGSLWWRIDHCEFSPLSWIPGHIVTVPEPTDNLEYEITIPDVH